MKLLVTINYGRHHREQSVDVYLNRNLIVCLNEFFIKFGRRRCLPNHAYSSKQEPIGWMGNGAFIAFRVVMTRN